ncbi:MAG: signal peptidase I [Oscillospiraceae bacterium]|nr:signal peptidase I [Oscillospiraceae bacterium]
MSEQTVPEQNTSETRSRGGLLGDLMDIIEAGLVTVFLFLLLFAYLVRPVTVEGGSMNPTLLNKDQILILMTQYEPKNGQIVVLDDEVSALFRDYEQTEVMEKDGANMVLVKRLIAKAGQTIDIDASQGTVKVDGVLLDEPYIADPTTDDDGAFRYPMTVPEGYIFVMGDNRLYSMDSRSPQVALIPEREILGTALFRYDRDKEQRSKWTERFDYLF